MSPYSIAARPAGVWELDGCEGDHRRVENLVSGTDVTFDDQHMWLAPYTPGALHEVWLWYDSTKTISVVELWNYSKTPDRGVFEFELWIDDYVTYQGVLAKAPQEAEWDGTDFVQPIVFTSDPVTIDLAKRQLRLKSCEQEVGLWNDMRVLNAAKNQQSGVKIPRAQSAFEATRPGTSAVRRR